MSRPLRIGFDVAQTCRERAGCAWYADSLARAIVAAEPENAYYFYHQFGEWINEDTSAGTRCEGPLCHEPLRDWDPRQAAALWQEIQGGKAAAPGDPDIVHANSFQAPYVGRARLVFTVYDVSFWTHPEFTTDPNRLLCQAGVFAALRRAAGFLFISESSRREFERILPGWLERARKPWAVTLLGSREDARGEVIVPEANRPDAFWLAVGTLEPRKNYETLLAALEMYWSRSERPVPLHIAGGRGWKSEALERRIAGLASEGKIRWLGYVPDEELTRLYASTRALIFPSWYEGFGLPVLEAMGQGAPVICSERASLPEVAGNAALYIDAASAESICAAMLRLEQEPDRRSQMTLASRAQAARFSWRQTATATLDFYRRVLAS